MLSQCQAKATAQGYDKDQIETRQLDVESLPFEDNSFDAAISSMVLGLVPNQEKMITEMARVTRPGGTVALATHGSDHYYEAVDAYFRAISKRYVIGYRIEFWPRKEKEISQMLVQAGLGDVRTRRLYYQDNFETGSKAHDFFACTSSSWWFAKFPPDKIAGQAKKAQDYFERKGVTQITEDTILAVALKP
jgi:SAM-dependent methyltransferase